VTIMDDDKSRSIAERVILMLGTNEQNISAASTSCS